MLQKSNSFLFLFLFLPFVLEAQVDLSPLWKERAYRSERISSYDQTGGNDDFIVIPKESNKTIAEISGPGIIKHIWITMNAKDPMIRRNAVIRMFWDGSQKPAVEVPIGDFFGQGWGEEYILNSALLVAAPKKGKSLNSYFSMPFAKGAKIEIVNESEADIQNFYFYIDYEKWPEPPPTKYRFFAYWNRKITKSALVSGKENEWALLGETEKAPLQITDQYIVLNAKGKGHFLGLNLYIEAPSPIWYGEGDDQIFIDGEAWPPRLHGTGTEDLFNTAWSPKEVFMHPYFGYPKVSEGTGWLGRTHLYRFWIESPITFEKSILFALEHGHANALALDMVSVAYWYQDPSDLNLPSLAKKDRRQNQPEINFRHIHKWRDAYRSEKGKDWGND